jgi:transglutaminase-like putative cysteine protease
MSAHRRSPRPHAANLLGPWGLVALALAVAMGSAVALGTAGTSVPMWAGFAVGVAVAGLTVAGLPSIPTSTAVFAVLASGGFVLLRHAGAPGADGRLIVLFLVAAIATIVLTERVTASEEPALGTGRAWWRGTSAVLGTVLVIVAVLATVLSPLVAAAMHQDVRHGAQGDATRDPTSSNMLSFSRTMDTLSRPRLSNRVVMTVEADRPSFWRGTTYDTWDGRDWTRASTSLSGLLPSTGDWQAVIPSPEDPAPDNGVASEQTFTLHAPYAEELFAAASPVRVKSDRPINQLTDGTLLTPRDDPLGDGTSYTVDSRIPDATAATLAAAPAGPIPENVEHIDLAAPTASTRLRALADSITAHSPTAYAKVQAIIAWLGAHTKYSLNAPLPPGNTRDAVDWFVFQSKEGWCEQISSALTIMLRVEGVPARVATGFATGTADPITGRYTVRERDAHAWTEVYFPGIGWQGFDPTSRVPLAGDAAPSRTLTSWLGKHLSGLLELLGVVGLLSAFLLFVVPRFTWRRARTRAARASWATGALYRLEAIGRNHLRPRGASETPRAYGAALATTVGAPDLVAVGEAIDRSGYGPPGSLADDVRNRFDAALAAAARVKRQRSTSSRFRRRRS